MALFKRWARTESPRQANDAAAPAVFSLRELAKSNAALAELYSWGTNVAPPEVSPMLVQIGCGERILDGFVNLDFIPHDARVTAWNLLDLWPAQWEGVADGIFSEDVLEHFFHGEQFYILCNANRTLRRGAVARTLMPSLPRLVDYGASYEPKATSFFTMHLVSTPAPTRSTWECAFPAIAGCTVRKVSPIWPRCAASR